MAALKFQVEFTDPAVQDLREIFRWVSANDSKEKATKLLVKLQKAADSLSALPNRGHLVPEINSILQGYLEIIEGPYRVLYQILAQKVIIVAVLDGRRNMPELLEKRLLG